MRKHLSTLSSRYFLSFVVSFLLLVPSILSGSELPPAGEQYAALADPNPAPVKKTKLTEDMVLIPAGDFTAGMDPDTGYQECLKHAKSCEPEWYRHEAPVHEVWIDAFYMDKYEVTQEKYERIIGKNPSRYKGANLPVERVIWEEANEYCEKVGKRLPTEAEWEKAARGKVDTIYPWGNEVESNKANFCDVNCKNYAKAHQFDDGYKATAPVGSYPPNGYGLYDMAGNVWEWVSDWYNKNYYQNVPRRNPKGPVKGHRRAIRGGSFGNNASGMRIAGRSWAHNTRVSRRGFRCALDGPLGPSSGMEYPEKNFFAPAFDLWSLGGEKIQLFDYRGKVVFINFWATWCVPCKTEMASMEKLYRQFKGLDFEMLAISVDQDTSLIKPYLKEYNLTFPVLLDPGSKVARKKYKTAGLPNTFIVGKDGIILHKALGARDWDTEELVRVFEQLTLDN